MQGPPGITNGQRPHSNQNHNLCLHRTVWTLRVLKNTLTFDTFSLCSWAFLGKHREKAWKPSTSIQGWSITEDSPPKLGVYPALATVLLSSAKNMGFDENGENDQFAFYPRNNRPALSGGMDWWRMGWPFSRVRRIFFRGRNFRENSWNSAERAIFAKFQAPKNLKMQCPKNAIKFHTPSQFVPPLDSLLNKGFASRILPKQRKWRKMAGVIQAKARFTKRKVFLRW